MLQNIFIYWLGILPLFIFDSHFEIPKVSIFLIGGFALTIFWSFKALNFGKATLIDKKDLWFLGWLLILLIAGLLGRDPIQSLIGGSYRHQGVIFFFTLFLVGKTVNILDEGKKLYLKKILATTVLIEALIIIFQVVINNTYFGKPLGTLGEPGAVAGFLAIGTYFVFETFPRLFMFVLSIPILFTYSRAGVLAYSSFMFLTLTKKFKPYFLVLITLFAVTSVAFFTSQKESSMFENRPLFWKIAAESIKAQPIIGYGAESQERVYDLAFIKNEIPLSGLIIDRAHNLFLDVTIWSGILGLILFSGWILLGYKGLNSQNKKAAMLAFLVYSFFQPLSVVHWTLLIVILNI